jgi:hypothetical protein
MDSDAHDEHNVQQSLAFCEGKRTQANSIGLYFALQTNSEKKQPRL